MSLANAECLSRTKLCEHNLGCRDSGPCRYQDEDCLFAHWLSQLDVPEEGRGNWSNVWNNGDVDISFWNDYYPNAASQDRFRQQFQWELRYYSYAIPNWAWGLARYYGCCCQSDVPRHVPDDYGWPHLRRQWDEAKRAGRSTRILTNVSYESIAQRHSVRSYYSAPVFGRALPPRGAQDHSDLTASGWPMVVDHKTLGGSRVPVEDIRTNVGKTTIKFRGTEVVIIDSMQMPDHPNIQDMEDPPSRPNPPDNLDAHDDSEQPGDTPPEGAETSDPNLSDGHGAAVSDKKWDRFGGWVQAESRDLTPNPNKLDTQLNYIVPDEPETEKPVPFLSDPEALPTPPSFASAPLQPAPKCDKKAGNKMTGVYKYQHASGEKS